MIKINKRDLIAIVVAVLIIFGVGLGTGFQMGKQTMPTTSTETINLNSQLQDIQAGIHEIESQNQYIIGTTNDQMMRTAETIDRIERFRAEITNHIDSLFFGRGE